MALLRSDGHRRTDRIYCLMPPRFCYCTLVLQPTFSRYLFCLYRELSLAVVLRNAVIGRNVAFRWKALMGLFRLKLYANN